MSYYTPSPNGVDFVRIRKLAELTGDTEEAIRGRIKTGVWADGVHYTKGPDGRIRINLLAYNAWAAGL